MKKTLKEEQKRILNMMRGVNENWGFEDEVKTDDLDESLLLPGYLGDLKVAIEKYVKEDPNFTGEKSDEELKADFMSVVEHFFNAATHSDAMAIRGFKPSDDEEPNLELDNPKAFDEDDAYHAKYDQNMTQGFKNVNEQISDKLRLDTHVYVSIDGYHFAVGDEDAGKDSIDITVKGDSDMGTLKIVNVDSVGDYTEDEIQRATEMVKGSLSRLPSGFSFDLNTEEGEAEGVPIKNY